MGLYLPARPGAKVAFLSTGNNIPLLKLSGTNLDFMLKDNDCRLAKVLDYNRVYSQGLSSDKRVANSYQKVEQSTPKFKGAA